MLSRRAHRERRGESAGGDHAFAIPCSLSGRGAPGDRDHRRRRAEAENWPAWRGPTGDGVSTERNLPVAWDTERNIAWKLPLPAWSGSTPIVWGDRIFLNVAVDDDDIELWCLDRDTGQPIWTRHLSDGNRRLRKQNMSSPSPVTDGEHVWVMTGTGVLKAFDVAGDELWMRDIPASYGRFGLNWGYASSPLLHDGALFVQVLHGMRTDDPSYVLRIDALSGETVWRVERPSLAVRESPDAYSTPALLEYDGTTEIVITGGDAVTGHDPESGRELWRADGLNPTRQRDYRIVASPLVHDGVIYAPTRVRPLLALRPGGRGDVLDSHVIWSTDDGPDVPTPVTDGEYFYVVNDRGIVYVTDAKTGAPVYGPERIRRGTYSASPGAGRREDLRHQRERHDHRPAGRTGVRGARRERLRRLRAQLARRLRGQIFIRTTGHLYAIGARREPPAPVQDIAEGSGRNGGWIRRCLRCGGGPGARRRRRGSAAGPGAADLERAGHRRGRRGRAGGAGGRGLEMERTAAVRNEPAGSLAVRRDRAVDGTMSAVSAGSTQRNARQEVRIMQAERILRTARIVVAVVIVGLCGGSAIETFQHARAVDEMTGAARALLASLSDEQAVKATFAFDSEERSRHHFIPPEVFERHGMVYADMDFEQRVRALDLLRSGLSYAGT